MDVENLHKNLLGSMTTIDSREIPVNFEEFLDRYGITESSQDSRLNDVLIDIYNSTIDIGLALYLSSMLDSQNFFIKPVFDELNREDMDQLILYTVYGDLISKMEDVEAVELDDYTYNGEYYVSSILTTFGSNIHIARFFISYYHTTNTPQLDKLGSLLLKYCDGTGNNLIETFLNPRSKYWESTDKIEESHEDEGSHFKPELIPKMYSDISKFKMGILNRQTVISKEHAQYIYTRLRNMHPSNTLLKAIGEKIKL
jgi:hypothetical protein